MCSLQGTATVEGETFQRSLLAAQLANTNKGKKAVDAPPVNIGWDSHKPVVSCCSHKKLKIGYCYFICD